MAEIDARPNEARRARLGRIAFRAWRRGFREADLVLGPFAANHLEPWLHDTLGFIPLFSGTPQSSGIFTISGAGSDVAGTSDRCHGRQQWAEGRHRFQRGQAGRAEVPAREARR